MNSFEAIREKLRRAEESAAALNKAAEKTREAVRARAAEARAAKLREQLKAACTHPVDALDTYDWHHGYGKFATGSVCRICGARRSFVGMGLWMTADEYRRQMASRAQDD